MDHPYFTLKLEMGGCLGYIEVNGAILDLGVPPEVFLMGSPVKVSYPVNHWVREGPNELLMLVAPPGEPEFPPNAVCRMTLQVRESGEPSDSNRDVTTLEFSGQTAAQGGSGAEGSTPAGRLQSGKGFAADPTGDVAVGEVQRDTYGGVAAVVSRSITLPGLNLPTWAFFDSDDITDVPQGVDIGGRVDDVTMKRLRDDLLPVYRKIWQAFKSKKVAEILPLYDERNRETDAAFHFEPGTTAKKLAARFAEAASDKKLKLWPITDDNVMPEIHDNNKLVRLTQNNQKALLCFEIVGDGAEYFDVMFRRSGDQWVITR